MSKTLPDFVSDDHSSTPAETPAPEPVVEAAPAAEATPEAAPAGGGQPRGPDGKFAPVAPATEAAPAAPVEPLAVAPAPAPAPVQTPEQAFAPLAALLDERDKRQTAEKEARELREWRTQQEAQARRQPAPDPNADPEGFRQFRESQIQAALWEQRREISQQFAVLKHGEEIVSAAFQWGADRCDTDPHFNDQVASSKDPVGFVVGQWQREQLLAKVTPEKYAAFETWLQAQSAAPAAPAAQVIPQPVAASAAPPPAPAAPRPSLASAPSAATSGAPLPRDAAETYRLQFG